MIGENSVHVNTVDVVGNTWLSEDLQKDLGDETVLSLSPTGVSLECSVVIVEEPVADCPVTESKPTSALFVNAVLVEDVVLKPHSQQLVEMTYECNPEKLVSDLLLFEPTRPMPRECLVGRSAHYNEAATRKIYCNVVNTGKEEVTLKKNLVMGEVSEIDAANAKFDEEIANFVPLDLEQVRMRSREFKPEPEISRMISNDNLTNEQRKMLQFVLSMHKDVFQSADGTLGRTKLVEHSVQTNDHNPIATKQYPIPTVAVDEIRSQTAQMLKDNVIRPSKSPWRSPVLLVKKKDMSGKVVGYRFCIDLTKVNAITVKDSYALPLIGKTTDALCGAKFFSNGDLDRAFWQVGLREQDKEKFAFVVDGKLLEPNVMPFGSMNAPSTFQRLVDRVLYGLTWKQCLVYLDDILIFSVSFEQHLCDIHETLSRFKCANLRLKPSKCHFARTDVDYLGFKISHQGIQASEKRVNFFASIPPPDTGKLLFSFLCSMTYYRKYIPNYGELTESLYKICESKRRLCEWTPQTLKSFATLKQAFVQAPILIFPNYNEPFIIHTDASDKGISCVLLQTRNGRLHPCAFDGRKLSETERRYSASERELLAIIYAYDQNYHHVYGRHIDFYTDHMPLVTMRDLKKPHGRLGRLFHKLSGVDYAMHYIPGAQNYLADFLSRCFNPETKVAELNSLVFRSAVNWNEEQAKDKNLVEVARCVVNDLPEPDWRMLLDGARWFQDRRHFHVSNGILLHGGERIVVPSHMKQEVLELHHDSPFAGHRGFETTLLAINTTLR